jgi:hypothetical protein
MPQTGDCEYAEIAVPLQRQKDKITIKDNKSMKTMNRMRMREYCCCCMMAMTMKGSVYIIGINEVKKKQYEKVSISNSSFIEHQHQQRLG